jgi:hypothetical protein
MDVACEALDDGTIVVHNVRLRKLKGWDKFRDVVDFCLVINARTGFLILRIRDY